MQWQQWGKKYESVVAWSPAPTNALSASVCTSGLYFPSFHHHFQRSKHRAAQCNQSHRSPLAALAKSNAAINILNPLSFTNCKQTHWTLSIAATLVHRALPGRIDHRHRNQDSTVAPCPTVTPPSNHFRPSLLSSHQLRSPPMIRTALRWFRHRLLKHWHQSA